MALELAWTPRVLPGLVALVLGWTVAAVVYFTGPTRRPNRLLALVIVLEATGVGIARGLSKVLVDPVDEYALLSVTAACLCTMPTVYLLFLSHLDTPLVRPLRVRAVQALLVLASAAGLVFLVARPDRMWDVYMLGFEMFTLVGLFGFAVALHAWRRAPRGTIARRRATAYTVAFGVRDVGWFSYLHYVLPTFSASANPAVRGLLVFWAPAITVLFLGLLAYGILRTQLFDIDLRIKRTLRGSTVAAFFFAAFFVASESAAAFFSDVVGTYVGIAAAGALVFALAPLQRLADRVADAAMPKVTGTDAYLAYRKLHVYRATLEEVLADGVINGKDRAVLGRMRVELEIDEEAAAHVEADVRRVLAREA